MRMAWIKPTSFNATNADHPIRGGSSVYLYMNGAGRISALYVQGSTQTGLTLSTGSVYHLLGSYDGTNLTLYVGDCQPAFCIPTARCR